MLIPYIENVKMARVYFAGMIQTCFLGSGKGFVAYIEDCMVRNMGLQY